MAAPPPLLTMCLYVLADLLTSDLDYWKAFKNLPPHVINGVLLHLPPLTLQAVSNELLLHSREWRDGCVNSEAIPSGSGRELQGESSGEEGRSESSCRRKRRYNGSPRPWDCSGLKMGMSTAWKSLFSKHWPGRFQRMTSQESESGGGEVGHGEADWQQLYWEEHLQCCFNSAAQEPSISSSDCRFGDILLPGGLLKNLTGKDENEGTAFATLRANCINFGRFARKLRLLSILCSPELVVLLKQAELHSIKFSNVRIRSDLEGICQLLTSNASTLRSVEFYHSMFSGETLNKIGKAMCPAAAGARHHVQHFALISSRILDQMDLFAINSSTDFFRFLCAARSLRSLILWDNSLEQENVVLIMKVILQYAKNICRLHLVDNELGEKFTRLFLNSMTTGNLAPSETMLISKRLITLDLRSNCLDGEAAGSLTQCLSKMLSLQHLNVSENPLEDTGIRLLVPYLCSNLTVLEDLSLALCQMTAASAIDLFNALSNSQTKIRRLSISGNPLGSSVVPSLTHFLSKCALETLDISDTELGPMGCSHALEETLTNAKTLLHIDLSKNRMSARGAAMLASVISAGSSSLTSINASGNLFSEKSITSIAIEIGKSKLYGEPAGKSISIDLRGNPGSFLCKLAGLHLIDKIGSCTLHLSDSSCETHSVLHDDDP